MPINVLVNGAFGKMGGIATKAISENAIFALVGQTGREYNLAEAIKDSKASVVIDFTHPDVVFNNTKIIIEAGARPVIGTSGLKLDQVRELQDKCKSLKRGGIIAPNFSLGGVLMMKYAKEIARYMPHAEIIELHHDGKADSPSGTAMRTAEMLAAAAPQINQPFKPSREHIPHTRGGLYQQVPIHSIRLLGLLAHQEVIFGSQGESLTIRHDTLDRSSFMPGIRMACEKVMQLEELVYGLEEVL